MACIYEVFPLRCSLSGAEMRIIVFITDPSTVRDILAYFGEPTATTPHRAGLRPIAW